MSTNRLGILGGTFDPPHLGHLVLAEVAADALDLAAVLFVPAADPPHKAAGMVTAAAAHRLAMVERAIAGNPRFKLSRADVDRPGPHYSVDMIRLLQVEYPAAALVFLIGEDSLRDLPSWSRPHELIQLVTLGVMHRVGEQVDRAGLERAIPGVGARTTWIDAPCVEISSSVLERDIAEGRSIRYRVPDSVIEYIETHHLYRKQS
jgi:nicotinate-nucleotide adenylyltransferase